MKSLALIGLIAMSQMGSQVFAADETGCTKDKAVKMAEQYLLASYGEKTVIDWNGPSSEFSHRGETQLQTPDGLPIIFSALAAITYDHNPTEVAYIVNVTVSPVMIGKWETCVPRGYSWSTHRISPNKK
jgi:hypothetical protein